MTESVGFCIGALGFMLLACACVVAPCSVVLLVFGATDAALDRLRGERWHSPGWAMNDGASGIVAAIVLAVIGACLMGLCSWMTGGR